MTQEEKAKAYDKALKVLHKYDGANIMFSQSLKEEMFPELKESEDERIRKELIEFVKSRGGFKQEYIAWLEKQGEHDMDISEATKQKLEDNLNKALEKETPESWNKFLDEQGEQKPAEWTMDNIEELTEFENAMMHIGGSFFGEHQGLDPNDTFVVKEQAKILLEMAPKQEWSEEDETVLSNLIWALKEDMVLAGDRDEYVSWLQSLKDKTIPQPKQKWKKEGKRLYTFLVLMVE